MMRLLKRWFQALLKIWVMLLLSVLTVLHAYETLKANEDIRLLISDIIMPEMDGKQLIQALRGDTEFKDLPIIIMSAVVGIKQIADLMNLGAAMFQPKPLDMNELKMHITSCLEYEEKKKTVKPV
jgi:two-component system OmpR family response regulator